MDESILTTIKQMCGIAEDDESFDQVIVGHINTVLADLHQLGAGPSEGLLIKDDSVKWTDFTQSNPRLANVVTYMYMRVRLMFDPPQSSAVLASFERQIKEFEWRINSAVDFNSDSEV